MKALILSLFAVLTVSTGMAASPYSGSAAEIKLILESDRHHRLHR